MKHVESPDQASYVRASVPRSNADERNEAPTLFVCHGNDGGPPFHPCRQVQEALRSAGIEYKNVIAAHGSPFPFLRGTRPELLRETGTEKLPVLKLAGGRVLIHPRAILRWIAEKDRSLPLV